MTLPHITPARAREIFDREKPFRPGWPATFEQAQQHPLISRVLILLAHKADQAAQSGRSSYPTGFDFAPPRNLADYPSEEINTPTGGALHRAMRRPYSTPATTGLDGKQLASGEKLDKDES